MSDMLSKQNRQTLLLGVAVMFLLGVWSRVLFRQESSLFARRSAQTLGVVSENKRVVSKNGLTVEEKIGQLIALPVSSDSAEVVSELQPGFVGLFQVTDMEQELVASMIGRIKAQASDENWPEPLVFVDQEGGFVQRLRQGFTEMPSWEDLCKNYSVGEVTDYARRIGNELASVGVDGVWAPVVDRSLEESSVLATRTCSADPEIIVQMASAYLEGLEQSSIMPVIKHFPGLGGTATDPHLYLGSVSKADWDVFRPLIARLDSNNKPFGVMVTHVSVTPLKEPCSVSRLCLSQLRKEIDSNEKGLIFSDALEMKGVSESYDINEAAYLAILAGSDVLVFGDVRMQDEIGEVKAYLSEVYLSDVWFAVEVDRAVDKIMSIK